MHFSGAVRTLRAERSLELTGVFRLAGQVAGLWAIARLAHVAVAAAHLPLPGNVVGLAVLFVLLEFRVVRIGWFEDGANFLVRHMSLFFVPLAVGALAFGALFARAGAPALAVLVLSGGLGIVVAGRTVVELQRRT